MILYSLDPGTLQSALVLLDSDGTDVRDASGRIVAPPQPQTQPRPSGPWDSNCSPSAPTKPRS